jgi:hypothetical protein
MATLSDGIVMIGHTVTVRAGEGARLPPRRRHHGRLQDRPLGTRSSMALWIVSAYGYGRAEERGQSKWLCYALPNVRAQKPRCIILSGVGQMT